MKTNPLLLPIQLQPQRELALWNASSHDVLRDLPFAVINDSYLLPRDGSVGDYSKKLIHQKKIPAGLKSVLIRPGFIRPPADLENRTLQPLRISSDEQDWMSSQGDFNPYEVFLSSALNLLYRTATHKAESFFAQKSQRDPFDIKSCVVVTGASKGIGARLAQEVGAVSSGKIVLVARSRQALDQIATEISKNSKAEIIVVPLDLGRKESAADLEQILEKKNLRPTALILNAGYSSNKPILEADEKEAFQEIMVNYLTPVSMIKRLGPKMANSDHKTKIIFVGSMACFTGFTGNSGYAGTRGAILNFMRSHRGEVGPDYPSLHLVTFGQINTDASKELQRWYLPLRSVEDAVRNLMDTIRDENAPFLIIPGLENRLLKWVDPVMPSLADAMTATVTGIRTRRQKKNVSENKNPAS